MIRSYICLDRIGRLLLQLVVGWLWLIAPSSLAQITLNVTNFGARGDAVQFFVNTTSNSVVVTTTNQLSNADIGKAIEVFGAGVQTSGIDSYGNNTNGNQDIIAAITNVVSGTNIYMSQIAQATLANTFATYGHDNRTNFQSAIAACGAATNAIINIPAGKFLFLSVSNYWAALEIVVNKGGLHFVGAGTNKTVLLSQGAWTLCFPAGLNNGVGRGYLITVRTPVTNDFPFSLENMTLDGGVQYGNTSIHGTYPNPVDGLGWDTQHSAFDVRGLGNTLTHMTWTNVAFTHWRGEMAKGNDSTNGNLNIFNCVFDDGNASAINIAQSINISNCVFNNLFMVMEFMQKYPTNTCYFQNNLVTNLTQNGLSFNWANGINPPFIIRSNTFYLSGAGWNGICTTPGDNIYVTNNQFICQNNAHVNCVVLGSAGYQGTFINSNIVVAGNYFFNPAQVVQIGGGTNSTDPVRVESVSVYGNTVAADSGFNAPPIALVTYGWTTNVSYFSNDFSAVTNGTSTVNFTSGARGASFVLVPTNNLYYTAVYDGTGKTNYISYKNGSRFKVIYPFHPGTVYALTDTNASQIPLGAQMLIQNDNWSSNSIPVYLDSALTRGPVSVDYGQSLTAFWTNGWWTIYSSQTQVPSIITNLNVMTNKP